MTTQTLTAQDWQLFSDMRGAAAAAKRMSRALTEALAMECRPLAELHMLAAMHRDARFGALDTEPEAIARKFLDRHWPHTQASFGRKMAPTKPHRPVSKRRTYGGAYSGTEACIIATI